MYKLLGPTPNLFRPRRSTLKKYPLQPTTAPGKPLPIYQVPRIPTEKEVADVFKLSFKMILIFY